AGAAALAAPFFDPDQVAAEPAATDSSLARLHGLYWLTANLAARRPLLVTVDDLHWCDLPSLRWIAYVLPRIEGIDLALVVGVRTGESPGHERLLGQILADPMAGVIRPPPLTAAAATLILRATLSSAVEDGF